MRYRVRTSGSKSESRCMYMSYLTPSFGSLEFLMLVLLLDFLIK